MWAWWLRLSRHLLTCPSPALQWSPARTQSGHWEFSDVGLTSGHLLQWRDGIKIISTLACTTHCLPDGCQWGGEAIGGKIELPRRSECGQNLWHYDMWYFDIPEADHNPCIRWCCVETGISRMFQLFAMFCVSNNPVSLSRIINLCMLHIWSKLLNS